MEESCDVFEIAGVIVDWRSAEEEHIGGCAEFCRTLVAACRRRAEVVRFVDYDEGWRCDVYCGGCAESFGADEVERRVGVAGGVEPACAECGRCDDEGPAFAAACDGECDVGFAESGRVGEECPAAGVDAVIEPVHCSDLVWQECDVAECDGWGAEFQGADTECASGEVLNERVRHRYDAARAVSVRAGVVRVVAVRSVRSSSPVQLRRGATSQ